MSLVFENDCMQRNVAAVLFRSVSMVVDSAGVMNLLWGRFGLLLGSLRQSGRTQMFRYRTGCLSL